MIGAANDRLFGILCDTLGQSEWSQDKRFSTNASRVANREILEKQISDITITKTTDDWLDIFEGTGLPYAKVNDVKETLEHEHVLVRDMVTRIDHKACGPLKVLNSPVKFSRTQPTIRSAPPLLGEHTDDVLSRILGRDSAEIQRLKDINVVK